ncbi:thiamine pyrophosphate-dependent enzyme [Ectothiorhodospira mobilis]|uniref:Indolepyruvate oxidoreductase subunit IorA n=1 Tax=Ectothiorhodospira mobilis TaxID=195064 RepID=A0A1I4PZY1_ECTMO|nr:thiamine pyrophosphate-dependent enzyme [Ectothiorhodospira mobilis]MCG5536313.1 thiamine pyrophosphate-dependent enzyme [Ectothiorhodospira mobilis]SFM33359.1 indolepyruvate ferredoxin oxidoreductase alpha subunit [Ectothiorhodospira mobilis]
MATNQRLLLSGNEAVALAALHAGTHLGTGYPGTPSTEILEALDQLGGRAQWAPNEKVALEVALGVSLARGRSLVTMKHVGVNVAADPLFTAAYMDLVGGLVLISADDPGMASSQNEQDNRHYARAAGVPMLEPADAQEAYDFTRTAFELSERWGIPVILRMTTRICHARTQVRPGPTRPGALQPGFQRDIPGRVMIPAHARPAHRKLRDKLAQIARWNDAEGPNRVYDGDRRLGIIASGVSVMHAREAAPEARVLSLGLTWPLPMETLRRFVGEVDRCVVIEEGDHLVYEALRADGLAVEGKPEMYRFGELNVPRVRRILAGDTSPEAAPPAGKPPELCKGCSHREVFEVLGRLKYIVAGDIGCYTLGVLPPFEAMDTCVDMGAAIGVGLGLRHTLPPEEARRVVSVIGDSTFVHSGLTGIAEMVYNPPPTGHVVLIVDNDTTAMTGRQEHPGTGRALNHAPTQKMDLAQVCRAMGVKNVQVVDPQKPEDDFEGVLRDLMGRDELSVLIARRPCVLAAPMIRRYEQAAREGATGSAQAPTP